MFKTKTFGSGPFRWCSAISESDWERRSLLVEPVWGNNMVKAYGPCGLWPPLSGQGPERSTWEDLGGIEVIGSPCVPACVHLYRLPRSCPDSDNYRCGPFSTRAVLSISVIAGCGTGGSPPHSEAHLESLPSSICVKRGF